MAAFQGDHEDEQDRDPAETEEQEEEKKRRRIECPEAEDEVGHDDEDQ